VSKQLIAQMIEAADQCLAAKIKDASNEAIKAKLRNLAVVCRTIVTEAKQKLSVPEVVRQYKARYHDPSHSLSGQTIRNKRPNGNPYMAVYRAWERVAFASVNDGLILRESDLHTIKDPTLRHQVTQIFAQNRSLHNHVNTLKKL
jgi:hypothetical protein